MAISREEVEKVSLLGRLYLSEQELDKMTTQMGQILQYMDLLAEVDTDEIEPMAHAVEVSDVFRDDQARSRLNAGGFGRHLPVPETTPPGHSRHGARHRHSSPGIALVGLSNGRPFGTGSVFGRARRDRVTRCRNRGIK